MTDQGTCRIVRYNGGYEGRQCLTYFAGISAQSVGSRGICCEFLLEPGQGASASWRLTECVDERPADNT
jgi:uncharacterized RmlC-like cupin family protein